MESGERIGNEVIRGKLASRGMAEVYRAAREGALGISREVCLKRVRGDLAGPEFVEMFCVEARLAVQLRHPNVVGVEEFGKAGGALFLAMEWVHGVDATRTVTLRAGEHRRQRITAPRESL